MTDVFDDLFDEIPDESDTGVRPASLEPIEDDPEIGHVEPEDDEGWGADDDEVDG